MNLSFLEYTAQDLIAKYGSDLSRLTIVFPNKRASLFMNEHLARMVDRPLWSPTYITISELFRQQTDLVVGDEIKLICDLHKVTVQCTGNDEPLDHFYGWGQLLLSDFDDIDKNM
ncbi:MAG: PD-(D/E)XK nuclease family protein, partial [Prevotella sp.]|nr:PD-(D/E)XK nuclease family protein [Prevotella sp.]